MANPEQWQQQLQRIKQITDKLGMPVDKSVVETVAVLQLLGFHTTASCSGHIKRHTGGPYIMFVSPEADTYRKQAAALNDPFNPECKRLYEIAIKISLNEQKKMFDLLKKFYASRKVPYGQMLTLQIMGYSAAKLYCNNAAFSQIASSESQEKILRANQKEIFDFTKFLKEKCL